MPHARPQFLDLLPDALPALQPPYCSHLVKITSAKTIHGKEGEFGRLAERPAPLYYSLQINALPSRWCPPLADSPCLHVSNQEPKNFLQVQQPPPNFPLHLECLSFRKHAVVRRLFNWSRTPMRLDSRDAWAPHRRHRLFFSFRVKKHFNRPWKTNLIPMYKLLRQNVDRIVCPTKRWQWHHCHERYVQHKSGHIWPNGREQGSHGLESDAWQVTHHWHVKSQVSTVRVQCGGVGATAGEQRKILTPIPHTTCLAHWDRSV